MRGAKGEALGRQAGFRRESCARRRQHEMSWKGSVAPSRVRLGRCDLPGVDGEEGQLKVRAPRLAAH